MGERFGRYELLRRIGVGGMAEVFMAKTFGAEGFVKELVIKRILPTFGEDAEFVDMFINEARLAARLQHANIVQIYDFDQIEGIHYLAMEWVDGPDLRAIVAASRRRALPIPERMAVHVGVETLKGLHYAHTRAEDGRPLGLVHRDISPHNLLVSFSGEIKITDFGIAKAAALASATRSGAVKGKLAYMAPEQVCSEPVDARTDLFALGIVVWELLAGRRLFQAESESELFARVRQAEVPLLASVGVDVAPEVEAVVRRLLAPRPGDRYQGAAEALGDLSRFAEVGDSLQVAAYLARLLPAEAGRTQQGETQVVPAAREDAGVQRARRDAPTRTMVPDEPAQVSGEPAPGPEPGAALPVSERAGGERAGGERVSGGRRGLLAAAVTAVIAVAGVGGWLAGTRRPDPPDRREPASLIIDSEPAGALVAGNGVILGLAPQVLFGWKGSKAVVEARWGAQKRSSSRRLSSIGERLVLHHPAGAPASRPKPVAVRVPATTPSPVVAVVAGPADPPAGGTSGGGFAPTKKARRVAGVGTLSVIVTPWAYVRIDSRPPMLTPIVNLALPAGAHTVELVNSELNRREKVRVQLVASQSVSLRRRWAE